MFNFTN